MRALLYRNLEPAFSPQALMDIPAADAPRLAPLIDQVRRQNRDTDPHDAIDSHAIRQNLLQRVVQSASDGAALESVITPQYSAPLSPFIARKTSKCYASSWATRRSRQRLPIGIQS